MRRILIIDDEQDLRSILSMLLRKMGYDVILAEDGEKGKRPCKNGIDLHGF
jgi:DNA-binding response OmpR family regulator